MIKKLHWVGSERFDLQVKEMQQLFNVTKSCTVCG